MKNITVRQVVNAAVIAALYAALTLFLAPISYGVMQVRVSEALCVLAMFTPAAVPGLTIGCFTANIMGPNGIADAVVGSAATLIGVLMIRKLRSRPALSLLPCVLSNGVLVGLMLYKVYSVEMAPLLCIFWVALGEAASLYVLGLPLAKVIKSRSRDIFD